MVKSSAKIKIGNNKALMVVCPKCGYKFSLNDTFKDELKNELENRLKIEREKIKKEVSEKVREEERKKIPDKLKESNLKIKNLESKLADIDKEKIEVMKKKQEIELREKAIPVKIAEEVDNKRKEWEKEIEEIDRKNYENQISQMKITIERQKKETQEMQARLTQGSQEAQGEIQELMLERNLRLLFPHDTIEPVPHGVNGADVIQIVKNNNGEIVGTIVWESKKTKSWSEKWINKLIGDRDSVKGDIGVLISETLPKDIKNLGLKKNIVVANFQLVDPIAYLLRSNMIKVFELKRANIDRTEKEGILYNFVLSNEFKSFIEGAAYPVFNTLSDIQKEKATMERIWKKREIQLKNSLSNLIKLYGNISGIADLPEIPAFSADSDSLKALPNNLRMSGNKNDIGSDKDKSDEEI